MFPLEIWHRPIWCLYDNLSNQTILKHPWRKGLEVPCPHCGKILNVIEYKAKCCNQEFKVGNGAISQKNPAGIHSKTAGRGWASLRPFR